MQAEAGLRVLLAGTGGGPAGASPFALVADELLHVDLVLLAVLPHPFLHLDVMTVIVINGRIVGRIDRSIVGVIDANPGETDVHIDAGGGG